MTQYHKRLASSFVARSLIPIMILILTGLVGVVPAVRADEAVVRAVLFWAETCPHCHEVMDRYLPPLEERYGDQLEVLAINISDPANYPVWVVAMEMFEVPPERAGVPMLFIGDAVLIGSVGIPEKLPGLIEQHLAAGGVDYPAIPGLENILEVTPMPAADVTPRPTPTVKACHMCDDDVIVGPSKPVVHMYFFYDRLCAECVVVDEEVLTPLEESYNSQLVVERRDVEGSTENYNLLRRLERHYGVTQAEMPVIFIGQYALTGEQEAREKLLELVEMYLDKDGVALPEVAVTPTPEATSVADADAPPIHVTYFYQPGCQECDRVQLDLNYLQHQYPQLVIHEFDVLEEAALCEWLGERASVPEQKRLTAPAVFVGDEALVGADLHARSLEALLARYADTGAELVWDNWESSRTEAASDIIERFRSFGLPTVLIAGLVDGLNPCAFATLVFFISYLAFMGRKGREVLLAGGAFALGVFLTYLGVGFGVLKFLATLPFLDAASRWIYGLTAVFCFLLAVGSLYDWWQVRRGKTTEMRLKMPTRLRRWVNRTIREGAGAGAGALVPVTFVTGVVVSVIELACTGQVYLPTILFVLGVPELQVRAGLYLVLYNLVFILPLVVVFVLAYFGTTSQQLGLLIHRHTATVKLATTGLFLLLAGWMVMTLI